MMADLAAPLEYRHVDVFSEVPFAGNGLIVAFGETRSLQTEALVSLTAEMRQFESIVVDVEPRDGRVYARIFTAQEELPFAGHPVIGAAAAVHERHAAEPERSWVFVIAGREIAVRSERTESYYKAEMNQGSPALGRC
jgi:trans-2,3-dihydro-3-hydroxyanthranilate isomerase